MHADDVKRFVTNLLRLGRLIRRGIQVTPAMRLRIVLLIINAIRARRNKQHPQAAALELIDQASEVIPVLPVAALREAVFARLPVEAEPMLVEAPVKKQRRGRRKAKEEPVKEEVAAPPAPAQPVLDADAEADAIVAQLLAADNPEPATDEQDDDTDTATVTEDSDDIRE